MGKYRYRSITRPTPRRWPWVVVALGLAGALAAGVALLSVYIDFHDRCVEFEAATSTRYQSNQNRYDAMWKTVQETAQVPDKYKDDFKDLLATEVTAKYGPQGSRATMQWFEERDLRLPVHLYSHVQEMIESGRAGFVADQDRILEEQRAYRVHLERFGHGWLAGMGGFPRPVIGVYAPTRDGDGDGALTVFDYEIVSSSRTQRAFSATRDEAVVAFE